jgi:hypothetical protein
MFRFLTCAVLLVAQFGCANKGMDPSPSPGVPLTFAGLTVENGKVWVGSSGYVDRDRIVIRSADQWTLAWATLWSHVTPMPAVPAVDFDQQTVVIASMGSRNSGGYGIEIAEAAVHSADTVTVLVTETSPGPNCVIGEGTSAPATAIVLPVKAPSVEFAEVAKVGACE